MCIRDRGTGKSTAVLREECGDDAIIISVEHNPQYAKIARCLLYTSDAADDLLCVDLGGRRIIQKKTHHTITLVPDTPTDQHTSSTPPSSNS